MRKEAIKELSTENFREYGTFAQMINPKAARIGAEPIEFFRDMVLLDLGSAHTASFSTCRVLTRPPIVDVTEYHTSCGEGTLPLDGDVLIHVAPATPTGEVPLDRIEIFRVPTGTMVALRPGVWHHAAFAHQCECVNVLIVLPERTYANDCEVFEITEADRVEIQGA